MGISAATLENSTVLSGRVEAVYKLQPCHLPPGPHPTAMVLNPSLLTLNLKMSMSEILSLGLTPELWLPSCVPRYAQGTTTNHRGRAICFRGTQ